jgi:hypothetical protein
MSCKKLRDKVLYKILIKVLSIKIFDIQIEKYLYNVLII